MKKLLLGFLVCVMGALVSGPAYAVEIFIAFGDSITEGAGDTNSPPGYPPKLQKILKKADIDARVDNWGLAGETTFEGLSRIDEALNGADYLLLMEGTNDINLVEAGTASAESIAANLDAMVGRAKARGAQAILGTVIPRSPSARRDSNSAITLQINWALYELTAARKIPFADNWARFNPFTDIDVFNTLYSSDPEDFVGHLNEEGYQIMAELFADQILGVDTLPPIPGGFIPFVDELPGPTDVKVAVFESANGAGIKIKKTFLEVNGEVVSAPIKSKSSKRRAEFSHKLNRKKVGCRVILGVSGEDQADPPNVFSQLIWAYSVAGREHLVADIDGDCTVDSLDLEQFAKGFGARFGDPNYNLLYDLNSDDIVDGRDLAELASDFGKSTD